MTSRNRILFLLGVASAVAVEIFAKGPWAHAVWAPAALMLFTDLEGVTDARKSIAAIPQRVRALLGAGGALAVELLADGRWAHAVWAPTAIMLLTSYRKVVAGDAAAPAPSAEPAIEVAEPSPGAESEAITPLDKPRPSEPK